MRLLRPLISHLVQRHRFRGRATALEAAPCHPYASLVKVYAGSPIAPALARAIEDMLASPHLTWRCKLLMFAIVARGLDCKVCAPEIGEALRMEGLHAPALTQALAHLDDPELDAGERLLLRFARETIWYESGPLQRSARALRDRLSGPQLLEAIGVASLANGLCRMGAMMLDHP